MNDYIPITNSSMELADCKDQWSYNAEYDCWCLEDILYTPKATVPKFQRLSIFVPRKLRREDGSFSPEAGAVVFENNAAGYMQMPHTWLGGPRCYAQQYLKHGLIYVTCGCRGRESRDLHGEAIGRGAAALVDLKTALRFLRHNRNALPGDWERVISVGYSAGGAMSSLLAVTGDNANFEPLLRENGAFMEESDAVFAAQIYCPIIDLEHADLAYEWMFRADKTCEDSPAGPAETMTPFKEALSRELSKAYTEYFNGLHLKDPETGEELCLTQDGRGGSGYRYFMERLNHAAAKFLSDLDAGKGSCTAQAYLAGNYTRRVSAPMPRKNPNMHHAGPGVAAPERPMSLGDLVSRPPRGMERPFREPPMVELPGTDKRGWLCWDGTRAEISDLDTYVLQHRRRMKPCTSFDKLTMDSGENQVFGSTERDYVHFSPEIAGIMQTLREQYPEEYRQFHDAFAAGADSDVQRRVYLLNPMNFIGTEEKSRQAKHYRIRVGASDADTSLSVSMVLALKLKNTDVGTVDDALVWDQPHCEADEPGEILNWIDKITANPQNSKSKF